MEEMRQQFDKWWEEKLSSAFQSCPKEHRDSAYHAAWLAYQEAWEASRSALVVELPDYNNDPDNELSMAGGEYEWGNRAGSAYAVNQCANIIRAAGITVKGEGDE